MSVRNLSSYRTKLLLPLITLGVVFFVLASLLFSSSTVASSPPTNIAVIYNNPQGPGLAIETFLDQNTIHTATGFPVTQISSQSLVNFDLIIIASDTASFGPYGSWGISADQYLEILGADVPVIGMGQGGYMYFGKLGSQMGYPNGGFVGTESSMNRAIATDPVFLTPNTITATSDPFAVYVSIPTSFPILMSNITTAKALGTTTVVSPYASLVQNGCDFYWAFNDGPWDMTTDGQSLFLNVVEHALTLCAPSPSPTATRTRVPTRTPEPPPPPAPTLPATYTLPFVPWFIPLTLPQPTDLAIHGIEFTQGVQCFDTSQGLAGCPDNSLPLVTQKLAAARIYLDGDNVENVPVRIHMFINGVEVVHADGTGKATSSVDRSVNDSANVAFNVNFGSNVTVEFYAEVDPDNTVVEPNESNNRFPATGRIPIVFYDTQDELPITGDRIRYSPSGFTGRQRSSGTAVNGAAAAWLNAILPIGDGDIEYGITSGFRRWTSDVAIPGDRTTSGGNQHDLIRELNSDYALDLLVLRFFTFGLASPPLGVRHAYGWVTSDDWTGGHADMPVYPHAGGLGVVGIGTDLTSGTETIDNPSVGTLIFGHELVHDYDLKHTNTGGDDCGSNDSSSIFPYGTSSIQEFGFNPATQRIYNPNNTHDLMSYCPAQGSQNGWISPYTWQTMFDVYATNPPAAPAWDMRADLGEGASERDPKHKHGNGGFTLLPTAATQSIHIDLTVFNPASVPAPAQSAAFGEMHIIEAGYATWARTGTWKLEVRDGSGGVLQSANLPVDFSSEYTGTTTEGSTAPTDRVDMTVIVPWDAGAVQVVLVDDTGTDAAQRIISANEPSVTLTSPSAAVSWAAGSTQTLMWMGSDPDGDSLTYSVYFSHDGGLDWQLLVSGLTTPSLPIDVDAMAGGNDVRFRVIATDGMRTGSAETPADISIPNKAPSAIVMSPATGGAYLQGELVVLVGTGNDLEDGTIPGSQMRWRSDIDGILGSGSTLPINSLSVGTHMITLETYDSLNASTTMTIQVTIQQRLWQVYLPTTLR